MLAKALKYGDTIGVISPASGDDSLSIKSNISHLINLGFKVKEGKHIYKKNGYLCGEDKDRAEDLMEMFLDKNINCIMCYRGGYGTMRILPLLDFKAIKKNPKIFIGYSDITALLNSISSSCSTITFHGPMVNSNFQDEPTRTSLFKCIMHGHTSFKIENTLGLSRLEITNNNLSPATGNLVGGNLSLICSMLGTPYEIDTKNKILFIEEIGEEPYRIDRMLTQLILSNKLQQCAGLILGQFKDCEAKEATKSLSLNSLLLEIIQKYNKPTLINFQSGHSTPKLTLPIGANVCIKPKENIIEVLSNVIIK